MIEYDYGFCSYQVKRNVKYANLAHSPEPFHLKQACAQAQKWL